MSPQQCMVCSDDKSKYKCPNCRIPYCSLACFRKHKETPCGTTKPVLPDKEPKASIRDVSGDIEPKVSFAEPESVNGKPTNAKQVGNQTCQDPSDRCEIPSPTHDPRRLAERPVHVDEQCEVLNQTHLENIAAASAIRDALKNEDLQKLICSIDSSENPEKELEKAMDLDAFRIFSDKVLSAANP